MIIKGYFWDNLNRNIHFVLTYIYNSFASLELTSPTSQQYLHFDPEDQNYFYCSVAESFKL